MPKTAAQTTTTTTALPTTTVAGPTNAQNVSVQVLLTFNGVNFSPEGLRAALDTAYGTVTLLDEGAGRPLGPFRYQIAP